jgi:hypothetical protein
MKTGIRKSKNETANVLANEIILQKLQQGQRHAARLVRRYGTMYWPIVERLQSGMHCSQSYWMMISNP